MYKPRKLLSQNFLHNRELVKKLIGLSSIGKNDLVLEIGSGDGIILEELIKTAGQVISLEKDFDLFKRLEQKYQGYKNLSLYLGDILFLPSPRTPYKVFANIPFSIEGELIRKFLNETNPPLDTYLVVRRDLAERFLNKRTLFNISNSPFFEFSIFHYFRRKDFVPAPKVEAIMFRFKRIANPPINTQEKQKYQELVRIGFGNGLPVFRNLEHAFGRKKTIRILRGLNISKTTRPSDIPLPLWISLYKNSR